MSISEARQILHSRGYAVHNVRAAISSSRRGIHGAPKYRVYSPSSYEPEVMSLHEVRELALTQKEQNVN